jgi:predicted phosphoribosyltransferase
MPALFQDRADAGRALASALREYADRPDAVVLALPRGGVPVAYEVAKNLHLPMNVFVVRKLGAPGQEELAIGAIASGGVRVLNPDALAALGLSESAIDSIAAREQQELERREREYRGNRPPLDVRGRTVILIDDGLATGSTMRAAVCALRVQGPAKIVVAVPVAAVGTCEALRRDADEVVCLSTPERFWAVGQWYREFSQTTDEEVRELLDERAEAQQRRTRAV